MLCLLGSVFAERVMSCAPDLLGDRGVQDPGCGLEGLQLSHESVFGRFGAVVAMVQLAVLLIRAPFGLPYPHPRRQSSNFPPPREAGLS